MIKHIIIWNFKSEMTKEEKLSAAKKIKEGLEGLQGKIHGLLEIHVKTEMLGSSNGDLLLDSSFISEEALKNYQVNPEHLKVAEFVRSVVSERKCADFIE